MALSAVGGDVEKAMRLVLEERSFFGAEGCNQRKPGPFPFFRKGHSRFFLARSRFIFLFLGSF